MKRSSNDKKVIENITKLKTPSKEKYFKNLLPRDEYRLKRVKSKQPFLTSAQIFEKAVIEGVKKDKKCGIIYESGSVKKILNLPHTKANILMSQDRAKKFVRIYFSKVILTEES